MPKNDLAEGENQSLERGIHRGIGRVKDDVKGFQMHPHCRRGIGEASVGKSVTGEQKTELVVDVRMRDRHPREDGQPHGQSGEAAKQDAQLAAASHRGEQMLRFREPRRT
jgi:hypothetical protein